MMRLSETSPMADGCNAGSICLRRRGGVVVGGDDVSWTRIPAARRLSASAAASGQKSTRCSDVMQRERTLIISLLL